jgi:hypothetical protein
MQMITMDMIIKAIQQETAMYKGVHRQEPNTVALGALQRQAIKEYLATCPLTTQKMIESNVICGLRIVEAITPDQVSVYKEIW